MNHHYATVDHHALPDLSAAPLLAALPVAAGADGPIFDRTVDCPDNDRVFVDWDAPLVWHHQVSQLWCDTKFRGRRCLHFNFESRTPKVVWDKSWNLWYDHAFLVRQRLPADLAISATLALEEVATGLGADNVDLQRPWAGLVVRMQDLRRYYFLTLEFPGRVVLYRRDDRQWIEVASAQVHLDVWTSYRLTLTCQGSTFRAWIDDHFLFSASDYVFPEGGYAGLRATCTAFAEDCEIRALPLPVAAVPRSQQVAAPDELPTPVVVRDLDLDHLGPLSSTPRHHASMSLIPQGPGAEPHLLLRLHDSFSNAERAAATANVGVKVKIRDRADGDTHACIDLQGSTRWTGSFPKAAKVHVLPAACPQAGSIILIGERLQRVEAATGRILAEVDLPVAPDGRKVNPGNGPSFLADLDGDGVLDTFFLTCGCNDRHLWAVDFALNIRWYRHTLGGQGHGHHLSVCDVDGDGRDEIIAGLSLLGPDGSVRWQQEETLRRLGCPNGHHIDATVTGFFDGAGSPASIHMASSSAGHLVIDALTGALLHAHPQGHVQTIHAARVLPGSDGMQVLSSNRWGSYGCTGIYDGQGRRLGRFQPGFTCQHTVGLNWTGAGHEHLLVCDGQGYRGIYDLLGCRLIDLEPHMPVADPFAQRYDRINVIRGPIFGQGTDDLLLRCNNRIRILSPSRRPSAGERCYQPIRKGLLSLPRWVTIGETTTCDELASFD